MGLFGNKNDRKLSFALGGYKFTANDEYVSYQSIYGKSFRVLRKDIESVSLDKGGMGKNVIKVNGRGTVLAEIELPKPWSEQAQDFIRKEALGSSQDSTTSNVGDLEKLSELKDKGIISQEEFDMKKKQILEL